MFIGAGSLVLFAICYVIAESWLDVGKAHRQAEFIDIKFHLNRQLLTQFVSVEGQSRRARRRLS